MLVHAILATGLLAAPAVEATVVTAPADGTRAAAPAWESRPSAVAVHTELVSSHPADGDTLAAPPDSFRFTFNEAVDAGLARAVLVDPRGAEHRLGLSADPSDARSLLADSPSGLPAGAYRLLWRVVPGDGHPVTGELGFFLRGGDPGAEGASTDTAGGPGAGDTAAARQQPPGDAGPRSLEAGGPPRGLLAALRGIGLAALLALAGLLAFRAWIAPAPDAGMENGSAIRRPGRGALLLGSVAAALFVAHLWAWARSVAGPVGGSGGASLLVALATTTGTAEAVRTGLALLALAAVALLRRAGPAAGLALAAVVVGAAAGHGAGEGALFLGAKAVHMTALAMWTGGLAFLLVTRSAAPDFRRRAGRVSRVALLAVLAVAVTGGIQTLILLPGLGSLFGSAYGRLVLAKIAGLGVLVAFGAHHRFRTLPGLGSAAAGDEVGAPGGGHEAAAAAAARLQRSVRWETAVQVAVVLLAGFLAYTPPPPPAG